MNNICFVVTNFNNTGYTEKLLLSLQDSDALGSPVIVVDNASESSHQIELKKLAEKFTNLTVVYNDSNEGYFAGLNTGIRYARKQYGDIKYLVIGNNDLLFSKNILKEINDQELVFLKYPVISPNIVTIDGVHQNPHVINTISRKREFIYDLFYSNYYFALLIMKLAILTRKFTMRKDELQYETAQEIYQGYGACYILGPQFFIHFDELFAPTFLMYEEYFLSKQLSDKGFKVFYEPSIHVQHYCHASTSQLPGKKRWQFAKAAHKEYRKYIKVWH